MASLADRSCSQPCCGWLRCHIPAAIWRMAVHGEGPPCDGAWPCGRASIGHVKRTCAFRCIFGPDSTRGVLTTTATDMDSSVRPASTKRARACLTCHYCGTRRSHAELKQCSRCQFVTLLGT